MRISDVSSDVCSSDLCTLRPLRATRLAELVRFGAEAALVSGTFALRGADRTIRVDLRDGARTASVAGKKATSLLDYFGGRSEARRVGKACVCTCRSRWSPTPQKKKKP